MFMLADVWLHTIDPFAVWPIRWYGLSYLVGFMIGWALIRRVARVGISPMSAVLAGDLVLTLAVSVVIGGRLGYVLFYKISLLWQFTGEVPFWGALAINDGGMASHGGMIGGIVGCLYFAWRHALPKLWLGDLMAFAAPWGLGLGRIANFVNGELIGRTCEPAFPLAVKFPTEMRTWPVERMRELMGKLHARGEGLLYDRPRRFVEHAIEQTQAGNQTVIDAVRPMLEPRHPSQLYAALGEGLIVGLVLLWVWRKPRKPGVVAFTFLIAYGIVRIIDELWRRPDTHIGFDWLLGLPITRGQWLSAAMVVAGMVGLTAVLRRAAEPIGGWRKQAGKGA